MGANESVPVTTNDSKTVTEDFASLMGDEQFYDVTIISNGEEYRAHKAILAARSEVFASMFKQAMIEGETNVVNLNIEAKILKETLRYIYAGRVENLKDVAAELIKVADQYMMNGLKQMCIDSLCQNVTVENAISTLKIADLYQVDILKVRVKEFIRNNVQSVIKTPAYKTLVMTGPSLLDELYRDLAANFKKK